jgi:glucoamylase
LSSDNWQTVTDTNSSSTAIEIEFLDIAIDHNQTSPIYFTFFWNISQNLENRRYQVAVVS